VSGLVALFHLDGRPAEPSVLEQLSAPLKHRAVDGQKLWISGSAGLAFQHFRTTPESTTEVQPPGCPPQMAICFDGRLDDRDDLRERLPPGRLRDEPATPDAALALAAYLHFGESFPRELKGDFAIALFDGTEQKLVLARDVMGIRPLHYCKARNTFLAASEIKAILAYPGFDARPDDDGLADLLLEGDWYERRITCFKDVFRVVPCHMIVVTAKEQRVVQYFDFDASRQLRYGSIGEYAEALRALFEQAVRRRLRSSHSVGVMVSGGLDSSAILCQASLLKRAGAPMQDCVGAAMTFSRGTTADEEHFLDDIETAYHLRIQRLRVASLRFPEDFLCHTEVPRFHWDTVFDCMSLAGNLGCRIVINGNYGDQMMHSDVHLVELARRLRYFQFRREFAALAASMADVEPFALKQHFREALLRDLTPCFLKPMARRLDGILRPDQRPSWYSEGFRRRAFHRRAKQWRPRGNFFSRQGSSCYGLATSAHYLNLREESSKISAARGFEEAYPFLDGDLVEFVMAIPAEIVNWQGRSKGLFREAMRGVLPESIRERNWKADFTFLPNDAAANGYPRFQAYLEPGCSAVEFGYLDPVVLQSEFSAHKAKLTPKLCAPSDRVIGTVALELWLRSYFQKKDSQDCRQVV
jgi:asparagine synthase (glutamine-hydrolysing)